MEAHLIPVSRGFMKPDVEDSIVANETSHASAIMAPECQLTSFVIDYESCSYGSSSVSYQSASEDANAFVRDPRSLSTKIVRIVTVAGISNIESRRNASLRSRASESRANRSGASAETSTFCDHVHSIEHPVTRFAYCGFRKHHHHRRGRTCSQR